MTDAELRSLLRQSREQGYRALFDTYFNYVYAIVHHVLQNSGSREDVEECVMDVFMEVIQHCDTEHAGTLKAFIGTIAKRRAIDWSRSVSSRNRHVTPLEEEQLSVIHSDQNVEQTVERAEQSRILMECIQTLGEPDASILIQKYFYERNSAEIGRIVGLAPTAVRMRCSRAMKRLKTELTKRNIIL
ncbi:MAG: sigma-70 family RNA polymerase sigma factor [Oscillospiraceae bacterium]|nr:sigma-70 family RNA polymerase sigma factor [Oscillospiraceae bacterium]